MLILVGIRERLSTIFCCLLCFLSYVSTVQWRKLFRQQKMFWQSLYKSHNTCENVIIGILLLPDARNASLITHNQCRLLSVVLPAVLPAAISAWIFLCASPLLSVLHRSLLDYSYHLWTSRNKPLTIYTGVRGHEEVSINCLGDGSKRVAGLQSVVAIVNVCGVLESQTTLQIVLVEGHLSTDVLALENLLLPVEPAQLGVGVSPNCELNASVMAPLRFS